MVHMNVRLVEKNSDIYNVEETANAESVFAVSRFSLLKKLLVFPRNTDRVKSVIKKHKICLNSRERFQ